MIRSGCCYGLSEYVNLTVDIFELLLASNPLRFKCYSLVNE